MVVLLETIEWKNSVLKPIQNSKRDILLLKITTCSKLGRVEDFSHKILNLWNSDLSCFFYHHYCFFVKIWNFIGICFRIL